MVEKTIDKKVVTLSLNGEIYKEYRNYCDNEGLVLSKQVEKFMVEELNKKKRNKR